MVLGSNNGNRRFRRRTCHRKLTIYQLSTMNYQLSSVQIKEIVDFEEDLAEATN
jgi:hypothetical protein